MPIKGELVLYQGKVYKFLKEDSDNDDSRYRSYWSVLEDVRNKTIIRVTDKGSIRAPSDFDDNIRNKYSEINNLEESIKKLEDIKSKLENDIMLKCNG